MSAPPTTLPEHAASLFVAGATGATGSEVTRLLLERGHHVRAFVHRHDGRSQRLADGGADVIAGDLHDLDAALDRPITYQPVDFDPTFAEQLSTMGLPDHLIQHLRHVSRDYQNGIFSGTNDIVERVGGIEPLTVAEFINTEQWPQRRGTHPQRETAMNAEGQTKRRR